TTNTKQSRESGELDLAFHIRCPLFSFHVSISTDKTCLGIFIMIFFYIDGVGISVYERFHKSSFSQVLLSLFLLGCNVRVFDRQRIQRERGLNGGEIGVLARKPLDAQEDALVVDLFAVHLELGAVLGAPLVLMQADVVAGGQQVNVAVAAYFVVSGEYGGSVEDKK
ncbi:MAG: hypothetical protein BYD32DRAFT_479160, partial [Podila humilis]